jgi:tetratricopeptide (TPR) repeat protein
LAMLLRLWAYFDHEDLWFELLKEGQLKGPLWFQKMTDDIIEFNIAACVLCDYGLVEVDISTEYTTESRGYSIHNCIHTWTIHVLNEVKNDDSAWLAITCISSKIPANDEREYWMMQRRLTQHGAYCLTMITNGISVAEGEEWTLQKLGNLFRDQGRFDSAEAMYNRTLQGWEKALGPDHISTLRAINDLGLVYRDQGRLDEAEAMFDRILQG